MIKNRKTIKEYESIQLKTVLRKLLEDLINGHQLIEYELNRYVTQEGKNPNSKDYCIRLDFSWINKKSVNQCKGKSAKTNNI